MGTRNRAFMAENGDDHPSRNDVDEIPSISKTTFTDGAELTKYVRISKYCVYDKTFIA